MPLALTPPPRPNMLRLLCHPDGYRSRIANWAEVARVVLARVSWESVRGPADPMRAALWQELLAYEGIADLHRSTAETGPAPLVIPVQVRDGDEVVTLLSAIATLGTAQDLTLRELRIEMFLPADAAAERWGERRLVATRGLAK